MPLSSIHDHIAACRQALLEGRPFAEDQVRPDVLASWRRCVASGLRPDVPGRAQAPPPSNRDERPTPTGRGMFCAGELFEELAAHLTSMGAMYLLVHEDGTVFFQGGNGDLQRRMASCLGSVPSLAEADTGTQAAALCGDGVEEAWALGAEHYLDCLQDYASYACWSPEEFSRYKLCVILPRALFGEAFLVMLRYFRRLYIQSTENYRHGLELARKTELFNQLKDIRDDALILVDYSQKILCVNKAFEALFDMSEEDVTGRYLTEIFPELDNVTACLLTGRNLTMAETVFEGLPPKKRVLYVTGTPWRRNGVINGMVVSLATGKKNGAEPPASGHTGRSYTFDELVGSSHLFQETKHMARSVAMGTSSIILTGESGTGKELFAQAIHNESLRRHKPFVAVNCSAIPKELIGSELFGYGDGAFTGARKGGAVGKFEYAHGGTLFLDEVAELPLEIQAILLRVLEERAVVRLGTNTVIPVDVRIISATNKNLLNMVREQTFRLDLYYRLNVIAIDLPPLRNRPEDIPLLVRHFLDTMHAAGKNVRDVSPEALDCLMRYPWPGNIRQLRNVIERGVVMAASPVLLPEDLPPDVRGEQAAPPARPDVSDALPPPLGPVPDPVPVPPSYAEWERNRIWELMQKHRANKSRIAEELGMSRGTLYKKIRRYGL